ncbi:hemerythrin domain-containing protein [Ramlibacter alkalitolerans]|uniref:Hemerythrin domain-containing protein n=1 Tax=Ramlibacter alkalitolerans TaxID=2039631 RepID=A0ABS1JLY6_9BURK|nr:hemerythrin domain-containing protein [Ramlibacter alkalitolerans]MBL0425240.1 hemerythrin domain-containing protein [Ramlibacter alkalitolerans]
MKLIDAFQDEHVLIDQVLGSFRTYVDGLADGTADPDDGRRFAAFFVEFAGHFHHDREEGVFFKALVTDADLPATSGPVHALLREHAEMGEWLGEMTPFLAQGPRSADDRDRLRRLAIRYSHALWRHIDAENSVLYVEGEERLGRNGIFELPDRAMSPAEAAAREEGARLRLRYRPLADASLTRGDGCFMCRAHGETCDGLEAEWWTELEWQEFFLR